MSCHDTSSYTTIHDLTLKAVGDPSRDEDQEDLAVKEETRGKESKTVSIQN
jgi:hypothetical protein